MSNIFKVFSNSIAELYSVQSVMAKQFQSLFYSVQLPNSVVIDRIYWTEALEWCETKFGPVDIFNPNNNLWFYNGIDRFYFKETYDAETFLKMYGK